VPSTEASRQAPTNLWSTLSCGGCAESKETNARRKRRTRALFIDAQHSTNEVRCPRGEPAIGWIGTTELLRPVDEPENNTDNHPFQHESDRRKHGEPEADVQVCVVVENEGAEVKQSEQNSEDGSGGQG